MIRQIIEFFIESVLETSGLVCVLSTLISISRSRRSLTIHPADRIAIEPIKNIINKIATSLLKLENAKIEKHIG